MRGRGGKEGGKREREREREREEEMVDGREIEL
jgi:hypothetical protein